MDFSSVIQEMLDDVQYVVERQIEESFESESFNGINWKPRKTQNRADRNTDAVRALLVDSGVGKRGINVQQSGFSIQVTSDTEYMPYHQDGDGKQEQRQFVGKTDKLEKEVEQIVGRSLRGKFDEILSKYRR